MSGTFSSAEYSYLYEKANKNDFEEVVDALILENYSNDSEIKDYIKSLPKENKRIGILSLIGDDNILWSKINEMLKTEKSSYKRLQGVYFLLRDYVKIAKVNAKSHGEILTPFKELAEPMVKLVNKYDANFWKNPSHKVLDSSAGYGTFLILAAYKFMVGLKEWEPDEEKRFKWIVENCLYYGELQARSVFSWLVAIDPYNIYETNTYWGSFLDGGFDRHAKEIWKVEKWDLIIQNPPYNLGQEAIGKRGGGDTLWDKFVIKSISLSKENGYLCFVHPTLWRKPQSERSSSKEVNSIMMKKQIHYLEMHNTEDGMKIFNAGTRYDFYLMENCPIYKNTTINDENRIISEVDLSKYDFIPNKDLEFFDKIIAKGDEERCPIIFNVSNYETRKEYVKDIKDDIYKYTLIHSTPKSGTRFMYSSRNDRGHFGIPKVIFGESGVGDVVMDINGDYAMTQGAMAIKIDSISEANNIKDVLLSKKFNDFLKSVMWSNFRIDWRLFTYIKKDFWKEFINTYRFEATLDNKKKIKFYGKIKNIKYYSICDENMIYYDIEISKDDYYILKLEGVNVCKHSKVCPFLSSDDLHDSEIKENAYYLHRCSSLVSKKQEEFYSWMKGIVSNPNKINIIDKVQKDINDQLIIDKLEVFDMNYELVRTERFEDGKIISESDIKSLNRLYKLSQIGI